MKHIKLFEDFNSLNEGAIPVYPAGNPYKPEGSIQWTGVEKHMKKWIANNESFTLVTDFDFNKYTADKKYRSIPLGTWNDKSLPLFLEEHSGYDNVEFDMLQIEENTEKPNEPWLRVADKDGIEFLIPPFKILDIQKGGSVKNQVFSGSHYMIDKMRATISNYYRDDVVEIKMQDGEIRKVPIAEWKKMLPTITDLDENLNTDK